MATTIQVSKELKTALEKRKFNATETYEAIIWDLLEDTMELSEETKRRIAQGRKEYAEGRTIPLSEVKKRLRL